MSTVTNTNIRVGPGVYLALKQMSDNSGMSLGALTNLFVVSGLISNWNQIVAQLSPEIQTALVSDFMSVLGDLFKKASIEAIKKTTLADLYQKLLNPNKNPFSS